MVMIFIFDCVTLQTSHNFKKRVVTPTFYVTKWKWRAYSTRDWFLVLSKRYLDCILAEPEEGCQRR